ncbi:hypothetical protein WA026_002481 [Henosepilachna vigintioctopunctata]|uniref:Uncharacterized protein n=1 Tax=Henosepilachna vigintioctopunctata TaxID=420089 RepID=A0AAW1U193_9CUCU
MDVILKAVHGIVQPIINATSLAKSQLRVPRTADGKAGRKYLRLFSGIGFMEDTVSVPDGERVTIAGDMSEINTHKKRVTSSDCPPELTGETCAENASIDRLRTGERKLERRFHHESKTLQQILGVFIE